MIKGFKINKIRLLSSVVFSVLYAILMHVFGVNEPFRIGYFLFHFISMSIISYFLIVPKKTEN